MTPTLFIGGTETKGSLSQVLRALGEIAGARIAMIEGVGHWMFDHAPGRACVTRARNDVVKERRAISNAS